MKKVMMLAAGFVVMVVAGAPAIAQDRDADGATGKDQYNTTVSGYVVITQTQAAALTQDCRTIVTVNQSGTATGGDQYGDSGDNNQTVEANLGGITVNVTGAQCQQIVNQVQAGKDAVGAVSAVIGVPAAPAPETPAPREAAASGKPVQPQNGTLRTTGSGQTSSSGEPGLSVLPDTGGASLLVLGTGALLVSGGLLVRRLLG